MQTIKSYTDIEQSKKLAEILPLESADMWYSYYGDSKYNHTIAYKGEQWFLCQTRNSSHSDIPAWSLAALLNILPVSIHDNTDEYSQLEFSKISVAYHDINDGIKAGSIKDNLVDACYEVILKLHGLNLL